MILDFTPIYNHFQRPKHVIKARDPLLAWINVLVEGFIVPSPFGTL